MIEGLADLSPDITDCRIQQRYRHSDVIHASRNTPSTHNPEENRIQFGQSWRYMLKEEALYVLYTYTGCDVERIL